MNFFTIIKNALFHPTRLAQQKSIKTSQWILYLFLLAFLSLLPLLNYGVSLTHEMKETMQNYVENLPKEMKIKDNELKAPTDSGFIYQNGNFTLSFDPDNKQSEKQLQKELNNDEVGISLQKKNIIFAFPNNSIASSMLPENPTKISYKQLDWNGITKNKLENLVNSVEPTIPLILFGIVIGIFPMLIQLLVNLVITAAIAFFYCKMVRIQVRFLPVFKLVTLCSTWPTILTIVSQIFFPQFLFANYISVLTIIIFIFVVNMAQRPNRSN